MKFHWVWVGQPMVGVDFLPSSVCTCEVACSWDESAGESVVRWMEEQKRQSVGGQVSAGSPINTCRLTHITAPLLHHFLKEVWANSDPKLWDFQVQAIPGITDRLHRLPFLDLFSFCRRTWRVGSAWAVPQTADRSAVAGAFLR